MKKKILIYDPISRVGGGAAYINNILPYLKDTKAVQFVFYCNISLKDKIDFSQYSIPVYFSPAGSERGGLHAFIQRLKYSKREIKKINPDIIIFMNQIPVKLNIPSILFVRNALYFIRKNKNYFGPISMYDSLRCYVLKLFTLASIKKSDLVLASSKSFCNMVKKYTRKITNVKVVPFGTNQVTISDKKDRPLFTRDKIYLLCLQYNFYKGIEIAVSALKMLNNESDTYKLIITDNLEKNSDKRARKICNTIKGKNIENSIEMVGKQNQSQLKHIYEKSDVFLFPSYIESFGHGILEAMANRLPCILTDIPVFKEIAGDAALYFKPGHDAELAEQIQSLTKNQALAQDMIIKGLEVVKKYSWSSHVEKLKEIALTLT